MYFHCKGFILKQKEELEKNKEFYVCIYVEFDVHQT